MYNNSTTLSYKFLYSMFCLSLHFYSLRDIRNIYANLLPNSILGQGAFLCCKLRRNHSSEHDVILTWSILNHNRNPKPSEEQPELVLHRVIMQDRFICVSLARLDQQCLGYQMDLVVWMAKHSLSSMRPWLKEDVRGCRCNLFH